jgi:hypothetical protein
MEFFGSDNPTTETCFQEYLRNERNCNARLWKERMATIGNGLEIRESFISGAGRGLFATRDFRMNDMVTLYHGIYDDEPHRYPEYISDWAIDNGDFGIIGASKPVNGIGAGSFANDPIDDRTVNAIFASQVIQPNFRFVYLQATRSIKAGEEILVSYGTNYWIGKHPTVLTPEEYNEIFGNYMQAKLLGYIEGIPIVAQKRKRTTLLLKRPKKVRFADEERSAKKCKVIDVIDLTLE